MSGDAKRTYKTLPMGTSNDGNFARLAAALIAERDRRNAEAGPLVLPENVYPRTLEALVKSVELRGNSQTEMAEAVSNIPALQGVKTCPVCQGSERFFRQRPARGQMLPAEAWQACVCGSYNAALRRVTEIGVSSDLARATVAQTDSSLWAEGWLDDLVNYALAWRHGARGIYFTGITGVGKSHAAATTAAIIATTQNVKARWMRWVDVIAEIRKGFRKGSSIRDYYQRNIRDIDLLVIDDLGDGPDPCSTSGAWVAEAYTEIIGRRCTSGKSLIVTSNMDLEMMRGFIGNSRVHSRMKGALEEVVVYGTDQRQRAFPIEAPEEEG